MVDGRVQVVILGLPLHLALTNARKGTARHHGYLLTLARNANDGIPDQNFEALNTSRSRFNRYA